MPKMYHKRSLLPGLAFVSAIALLASCDETIGTEQTGNASRTTISFNLGGNDGHTRSALPSQTSVAPLHSFDIQLGDGLPALTLTETVTSADDADDFKGSDIVTRGIPVFSSNFADVYGKFTARTFSVSKSPSGAYTDAQALMGTTPVDFTKNGDGNYVHDYGNTYRWPSNHLMYFFLASPRKSVHLVGGAAESTNDPVSNIQYNQDGSIEFGYTSPAAAIDQEDILFTSRKLKMETKDTDNRIVFLHPLTGVKFKLGTMSDDNYGVTVTVTSITIKDLLYEGSCKITTPAVAESTDSDSDNKFDSKNHVSWTFTESQSAKKNNFSIAPPATLESRDKNTSQETGDYLFPDNFYGSSGAAGMNNLNSRNYAQTFWLIPQSCSGKEITIQYEVTFADGTKLTNQSKDVTLPADHDAVTYAWNAGELHTYTIGFHQTHVSISDEVSSNTLTFAPVNTGNTVAYLRVALVADWVNNENVVFGKYDVPSSDVNTSWKYNSADGFYYLCTPVAAGATAEPLMLQDFTPVTAPIVGTHLELSTIVQAVQADDDLTNVETYWGDYAKTFINAKKN